MQTAPPTATTTTMVASPSPVPLTGPAQASCPETQTLLFTLDTSRGAQALHGEESFWFEVRVTET